MKAIEPHTESDSVALLAQLLCAFGNAIGRQPHFTVDGVRQGLNLFVVLVGLTSKGRKGTAWARVKNVIEVLDSTWTRDRVQSGLSSGEGLIWAVRDPIVEEEEYEKKGETHIREKIVDPGVSDKRLLVVESEFASVLKMCGREGNVLSPILRQAWDGQDLQVLTRNNPIRATEPHISVVGHVTKAELMRHVTATEQANGFANRFMWFLVRRSKFLPDGGALDMDNLESIPLIYIALDFARRTKEMRRDAEASELWRRVYVQLSGDRFGLWGAVTGRAEAQTMRLACLYALLDVSAVVRVGHLAAALSLWGYADLSAKRIFGDALGDPTADDILRALRAKGSLTRRDINDLFQRNKTSAELSRALNVLDEHGLAHSEYEESGGRPVERWTAVSIAVEL